MQSTNKDNFYSKKYIFQLNTQIFEEENVENIFF